MTTSGINFSDITVDQIGKCHKVYDYQTKSNFYQVENSRGEVDESGNIVEYQVRYTKGTGFTCTCSAGLSGFAHCRNFCWHVRASLAAAAEEKAALKELAAATTPKPQAQIQAPAWMLTASPAPHMKKCERR